VTRSSRDKCRLNCRKIIVILVKVISKREQHKTFNTNLFIMLRQIISKAETKTRKNKINKNSGASVGKLFSCKILGSLLKILKRIIFT
tara:strand:- start:1521 stop:1784 length:264 start_codon:yes stop_codon:yes gene_type:complete